MSTPTNTAELPAKYVPADHEPAVSARWDEAGAFKADPSRVLSGEAKPYCIIIPPPTLQDILIRNHRMRGYETLWMPGTDHAGIATQTVVEKRVLAEEGKKRTDFERADFVAKIQAFKDEYEKTITKQLKAMGCSCDWDRQRFTMDDICARAVREAFFRLFKDEDKDRLIYRGERLVNWDPVTQTALADDEVEMHDVDSFFWYFKYPIVDSNGQETGEHVTVATTRPETYFGDTAVAVNPKDPDRKHLIGQSVKLPFVNRVIPIIGDDYVVMPDPDSSDSKAKFASGFLKVTPAHDTNDWEIGLRHALPVINVMAPDASISADHGWKDIGDAAWAVGQSREDARKLVEEKFSEAGLMAEKKPYTHAVGHSYRSHAAIEPYLSDQWYVKVTDDKLRGAALRAMNPEQRSSGGSPGGPALRAGCENNTQLQHPRQSLNPNTVPALRYPGFTPRDPYPPGEPSPNNLIKSVRDLPHLTLPDATYFVTWRTTDGTELSPSERDKVLRAISHHHGSTVQVYASVVMPNHVHCIVRPYDGHAIQEWTASVKRFSATTINHTRGRSGSLWQSEHFDHIVRDERWFAEFLRYILNNSVEAELCSNAGEYPHIAVDACVIELVVKTGKAPGSESHATNETTQTKAGDGGLTFHPSRYAKTYEQWHENLRDWCISRQLWWGHRIPVWSIDGPTFQSEGSDSHSWGDSQITALNDPNNDFHAVHVQPQKGTKPLRIHVCLAPGHESAQEILEEAGYTQDPDVLDTWFSSALWPMSTMGWPDAAKTDDQFTGMLEAFNPSSVLTTAREIITLWVSRMVMFNRYLLAGDDEQGAAGVSTRTDGQLPFSDVFIHAMIQDGDGRKMSKSLGNGVDPLDIIESHGTDAMRYTLCEMTTQTQDVRMPVEFDEATGKNTSNKFDKGRNFCSKLWNATKFVIMMLGEKSGGEPDVIQLKDLDTIDRWMLSRLARATKQIDEAIGTYQFSIYAQQLFDILRSDYCDWYLEGVKPTLATKPGQRIVLQQALETIIRLLHPVAPFITETLNGPIKQMRIGKVEGLELPAGRNESLLCTSGWPEVSESLIDDKAESDFERMQNLVEAIRKVRAQHKVPPRRKIVLHADADIIASLGGLGQVTETLAGLGSISTADPKDESVPFDFESVELKLSDLADAVDASVERERIEQQIKELDGSIMALEKRLANPGYADKAPAKLVEETRKKLEQQKADRDAAASRLKELG